MGPGPVSEITVTPGLGWPRNVVADPVIGWPRVSRETLDWPNRVRELREAPLEVVDPTAAAQALEAEVGDTADSAETASPPTLTADPRPPVLTRSAVFAESGEACVALRVDGPETSPPPGREPSTSVESKASTGGGVAVLEREREREAEQPFRPPGPRRAKFDQEEFPPPPVEPPSRKASVSRETSTPRALPRPAQTRTFVVANQKGGVGKTTTAVNVAAALAMGGLSVLVVDLDPQGNASTALGIDHHLGVLGTYDVLIAGKAIADLVVESPEAPGLMVLPATIDLAGAEIELVSVVARENRLLRSLKTYLESREVDYVILDCPPSLGLLTLNALVAATEILIPIQCEYYALEGVSQLMRTINLVKGELNSGLQVSTVLLTMFDARTRLAAQVAQEVRTHFAAETLPTVIPRSVRISEAPSYGQTVLTYHPDSAGAVSYLEAAREIARRGAQEDA